MDQKKTVNKIIQIINKYGIQKYIADFDKSFVFKDNESDKEFMKRLKIFVKRYHPHSFLSITKSISQNIKPFDYSNSNRCRKQPDFVLDKKHNIGIITFYSFILSNDIKKNKKDEDLLIRNVRNTLKEWLSKDYMNGFILDFTHHHGGSFWPIARAFSNYFNIMFGFYQGNKSIGWVTGSKSKLTVLKDFSTDHHTFPKPIAVITGSETSSSGEFAAAIFYKKEKIRFFGKPTHGDLSSNLGKKINDYIELFFPTSIVETSSREVLYDEKIIPDVITNNPYQAAIQWIIHFKE
jgi:C-terminal processing protease CtpA/Prc